MRLMIRCMDYNDIYWKQDPSHPSDIFPAALAGCERAKSGGKELIVGLVLGHEFEMRFCEAAFPGIRERGWHHATLTAFVSPIVAGRVHASGMGTDSARHRNLAPARHATLGAVTAGKLTMMKNTVDPMATQSGSAGRAAWPRRVTPGPSTWSTARKDLTHCFGPAWKLNLLTDGLGESWRITQCGMKAFPTEALTHTPISAVLDMVKTNDLKPERGGESADSFHWPGRRTSFADPSKYDPQYEGDGRPLAPLCDRGGHRGAAGHAGAVRR